MIHKEQIAALLIESCPSFRSVYEVLDDKDLDYIIAGDFSDHLLNLYKNKNISEFTDVARLIERFHVDGDSYVQNYATVGILEGIQNSWAHSGIDPEVFTAFLLPESLKAWNDLNDVWGAMKTSSGEQS